MPDHSFLWQVPLISSSFYSLEASHQSQEIRVGGDRMGNRQLAMTKQGNEKLWTGIFLHQDGSSPVNSNLLSGAIASPSLGSNSLCPFPLVRKLCCKMRRPLWETVVWWFWFRPEWWNPSSGPFSTMQMCKWLWASYSPSAQSITLHYRILQYDWDKMEIPV